MPETEDNSTPEGVRAAMRRRAEKVTVSALAEVGRISETCDCDDCVTARARAVSPIIEAALLQAYPVRAAAVQRLCFDIAGDQGD